MDNIELTPEHYHLIAHSLGINIYYAAISKNQKDKFLPKKFYRNYFASSTGGEDFKNLLELQSLGLTDSWERGGRIYFEVTPEGIDIFKKYFNDTITQPFFDKITD